jgi:hypothetical protein
MPCAPGCILVGCSSEGRDGRGMRHVSGRLEMRARFRGKMKGRSPLRRPRRRWVDNIKMDLLEVGCGSVDWIEVAQDRESWRALVTALMNFPVS